jgi:hypothetical protein
MEGYIIFLENKNGDTIALEEIVTKEIHFPKIPIGGEKIILNDFPKLIEYFKSRASPFEELQKRFSNKTYIIKEIKFGEKNFITAIEEH